MFHEEYNMREQIKSFPIKSVLLESILPVFSSQNIRHDYFPHFDIIYLIHRHNISKLE